MHATRSQRVAETKGQAAMSEAYFAKLILCFVIGYMITALLQDN